MLYSSTSSNSLIIEVSGCFSKKRNIHFFCFLKKNNETKFTCPRCNKEYCLKCFKTWHNNTQCEQNNFQSIIKNNKLESLSQIGNDENYIECPKCHAYLQKIKQFNSIICICGSEICCKCGKVITQKHNCT